MNNKIYCGIDPGQKGAFSFLDHDGHACPIPFTVTGDDDEEWCYTPTCLYMPKKVKDIASLASALNQTPNIVFVLEDPIAFPGFSIKTYKPMFEQLGVLKALFPDAILVGPRTWQAAVWNDAAKALPKGTNAKERSLLTAKYYWKHCTFREDNEPGKPHDGIVDAMLIAMYGVLTQGGVEQ